ncbi:MAG: HDOD domain-containing protein [Methyloprofundus sp.]|nr:HDOD domain-containing protein [Methyloprofundus sp.]
MPEIEIKQLDISKLKNLPALPEESGNILAAINDPDIELEDLVRIISSSPILVARLLGLANSAYFGYAGKVTDLRVAVINVLGLKLVKSLSLSVLLNMTLDSSKCSHFDTQRFWHNALLTAICAQKIAKVLRRKDLDPASLYTAGILLNIGLLAAVYVYPDAMDSLFIQESKDPEPLGELMAHYYATDQYVIGGYLLRSWQLPVAFQQITNNYLDSNYSGDELPAITLLKIASLLVKMINENTEEFTDQDMTDLLQFLELKQVQLLGIKNEVSIQMEDFRVLVQALVGG